MDLLHPLQTTIWFPRPEPTGEDNYREQELPNTSMTIGMSNMLNYECFNMNSTDTYEKISAMEKGSKQPNNLSEAADLMQALRKHAVLKQGNEIVFAHAGCNSGLSLVGTEFDNNMSKSPALEVDTHSTHDVLKKGKEDKHEAVAKQEVASDGIQRLVFRIERFLSVSCSTYMSY